MRYHVRKEKNEILNAHEMSKEEMEAIAGGGPRIDWRSVLRPVSCYYNLKRGCK